MTHQRTQQHTQQQTPRIFALVTAVLVALLFGSLLAATAASATLWVRVADQALVRQVIDRNGLIVQVEAGEWNPAYGARMPSTDQRMLVQRVIYGNLGEGVGELTVRWRGGETADGLLLKVQGVEPLPPSARALLFVKPGADGTYDVFHLFQGVFEIARYEGRDLVFRSMGGTEVTPPGDKQLAEVERPRELDAFTSWIQGVADGAAPAQSYWRDVPEGDLEKAAAAQRGPSDKYTFFDNPFRWVEFDVDLSVPFRAHEAGQEGLANGGFTEFSQAIGAWNSDIGSRVKYNYAGKTTATGGFDHSDGVNTILFNDLNDAGGFDEDFSCTQGGVIATGGGYAIPNNHTHQGQLFGRIVEADIITNKNTSCILGTPATAREVFGHELGHTLGLGHSCGGDAGSCAGKPILNDALMRATAHADGRGARLNSDDKAGINFLYPAAAQEPPAAPTGLSASNGGFGVVNLSWNDNASNEGGYQVERRTGGGSFTQIASPGANSTSYQDSAAPTGSSVSYRVRATNTGGASGYSNTATLTTTGASPPSNLAAVALSPDSIQLTWTDNTDDETGFEIQIRRQPGNGLVFGTVITTSPNQTIQVFDELFTGTSFQFRVRAVTAAGNSSWSSTSSADTPPYIVGEPCENGTYTMCLNGERFQNRVLWSEFTGKAGFGRRVVSEQSLSSGMFWFFGSSNWEVLVKNLNGCGVNQSYWVFSAATTSVEYTLQVVDTWTGDTVTYFNPLGMAAPAVTDTSAFENACGVAAPFAEGSASTKVTPGDEALGLLDKDLGCEPVGAGIPTTLFLDGGRFEVEVDWRDFQDGTGPGKVVEFCSNNSGLFWFFGANNWELLVKVIDGCSLNGRYWVFSAATTSVEYTLRVTDTQAGVTKTFFNPLGQASNAITDTNALDSCP